MEAQGPWVVWGAQNSAGLCTVHATQSSPDPGWGGGVGVAGKTVVICSVCSIVLHGF